MRQTTVKGTVEQWSQIKEYLKSRIWKLEDLWHKHPYKKRQTVHPCATAIQALLIPHEEKKDSDQPKHVADFSQKFGCPIYLERELTTDLLFFPN